MTLRKLTEADVVFYLECEPEDIPVRGNCMASGDDAFDKECEDKILAELDDGNEWAWCCVKVTARLNQCPSLEGNAFLGGCSYESEEDFIKHSGYYEDMKRQALADLQKQVDQIEQQLTAGGDA